MGDIILKLIKNIMFLEIIISIWNLILVWLWIIIASQWLSTWRRQMHWKDKYIVSKDLLKYTYKFRDNVKKIRNPFVSVTEFWETPINWVHNESYYQMKWAYLARIKRLELTREKINEILLDAEAIWWLEILKLFEWLFEKQHKLFSHVRWYLQSLVDVWYKNKYKEEIIYSISENDDEYFQKLQKDIEKIEAYLKPNMK